MNHNAYSSVAAVDIGTARTKVAIGRLVDGEVSVKVTVIEESVARDLKSGGFVEASETLIRLLSLIETTLAAEGVVKYCVVGAQVFRHEETGKAFASLAKKQIGDLAVITPSQEAAVYHSSILLEMGQSKAIAVDVGGGSVQVVWGSRPLDMFSAPLGTYSIQEMFQEDASSSIAYGSDAWCSAEEAVCLAFSDVKTELELGTSLVVGSSIMRDFFSSAFEEAGIANCPGQRINYKDIEDLAKQIGGKPYSETFRFFEQNSGFMYGADKLLIVVMGLMKAFGIDTIQPTNASVSKGICSLLSKSPEQLASFGVPIINMVDGFKKRPTQS